MDAVTLLFGECGEGKNVRDGRKEYREVGEEGLSTSDSTPRHSIGNSMSFCTEYGVLFQDGLRQGKMKSEKFIGRG